MPPRTTTATKNTTTRTKRGTSRANPSDIKPDTDDLADNLRTKLTIASNTRTKSGTTSGSRRGTRDENAAPNPDDVAEKLARTTLQSKPAKRGTTAKKGSVVDVDPIPPTTAQKPEERKAEIMRTVNTASQGLSAAVQGRNDDAKPKKGTPSPTELANTAQRGLRELRELMPQSLDVERAASSVVGKLLALNMASAATDVMRDMHPQLLRILGSSGTEKTYSDEMEHTFLPTPSSSSEVDAVLVSLCATYLSHALSALSKTIFLAPSSDPILARTLSQLRTEQTLLHWHGHLSPHLSSKQADSIFSRVYSTLVKSSAEHSSSHPRAVFTLRAYALSCLLQTEILEASAFWEQATRFCISLVQKSGGVKNSNPEDAEALAAIKSLVETARKRGDAAQFLDGQRFLEFCECWLDIATRANSRDEINVISELMGNSSSSQASASSNPAAEMPTEQKPTKFSSDDSAVADRGGLRICISLVQASDSFEKWLTGTEEDELRALESLQQASSSLHGCGSLLAPIADESSEGQRTATKLRRVIDKLRRQALKCVDGSKGAKAVTSAAEALLLQICNILEAAASESPVIDFLSPALDTLFVLARVVLIPADPDSHTRAYKLLDRASVFPGLAPLSLDSMKGKGKAFTSDIDSITRANYVRCISGAFHNLSASLYQASRFASAARFLTQACNQGLRALELHQIATAEALAENKGEAEEKNKIWGQLAEQVYRRWELLGVCQSKVGERQLAHNAFVEAIAAYAYANTGLEKDAACFNVEALFNENQQLSHIIERATYIATSELLLPPDEVPLSVALRVCQTSKLCRPVPDGLLGIILERQITCLEQSKWKGHAQEAVHATIAQLLNIYSSERMPLRRARALIKYLHYGYYSEGFDKDIEKILEEVTMLALRDYFADDVLLAPSSQLIIATAELWCALHVHQRPTTINSEETEQLPISRHSQNACQILNRLLSNSDKASPKEARSGTTAKPPKVAGAKASGRRVPSAPVKSTSRGKKATAPKSKSAQEAPIPTVDAATPRRSSISSDSTSTPSHIGDLQQLLNLLETLSTLLGLVGDTFTKLCVLHLMRRLSESHLDSYSNCFVKASCELANEYIATGRIKKAANIYTQAGVVIKKGSVSEELRVLYMLRLAESMARSEDVLSGAKWYCDALATSENIVRNEKAMSTSQRVHLRVSRLELAASAAHTFAVIQHFRDDSSAALEALLQALRLWNRAAEHLARLNPSPSKKDSGDSEDPFATTEDKSPMPTQSGPREKSPMRREFPKGAPLDGFEWRIAEGTLSTLFALVRAYFLRGSAREAGYFAQQAEELSLSINAPAMAARALARRGEVQLHCAKLDEGEDLVAKAAELVPSVLGIDAAEICRLHGLHQYLSAESIEAQQSFAKSLAVLSEAEKALDIDSSSKATATETFAPALLAAVLRQHIWLLREESSDEVNELLTQFTDLPASLEVKAEQQALLAKMTLREAYDRFGSDMFLSSLTESTIALPMGMSSTKSLVLTPAAQEVLIMLANAEQLFWADLTLLSNRGRVSHVREAAISLATIAAFRSSLGRAGSLGTPLAAGLLDAAAAITLRREMLEAIPLKFRDGRQDDMMWPRMTANGTPMPSSAPAIAIKQQGPVKDDRLGRLRFESDEGEGGTEGLGDERARRYWQEVEERYRSETMDESSLSASAAIDALPLHWTVVNINVSEDKTTLFVSRRRAREAPLLFCLPLKGRREGEEEHLGFEDAVNEMKDIIRLSDENTRKAKDVDKDDKWARAAWWAERGALDKRMKELLESIEFCWLGAFKTILNTEPKLDEATAVSLHARFDKIFGRALGHAKEKQRNKAALKLDDALLATFATLSPKCRDEELEDVVYFVLDLYQTHGLPVVLSEIDVDQLAIDFRGLLEEHARERGEQEHDDMNGEGKEEAHLFLVLDKNVQGIPWESIPSLRGRSVSRVPDVGSLIDRVTLERMKRGVKANSREIVDRATVDPKKAFYILNPGGDLKATEERLRPWTKEMKAAAGWKGIVGRAPSEQEFLDALERKELVVYFGHGGGEQYVRSHKIRHLTQCAVTMLWGCSSGALRDMGEFDRTGTPHNYMLAGCPTLVANLWDVTDKDIDKFTMKVFEKLGLTKEGADSWSMGGRKNKISVARAVAEAREECKLTYLTGAAPVVYGIPFYL